MRWSNCSLKCRKKRGRGSKLAWSSLPIAVSLTGGFWAADQSSRSLLCLAVLMLCACHDWLSSSSVPYEAGAGREEEEEEETRRVGPGERAQSKVRSQRPLATAIDHVPHILTCVLCKCINRRRWLYPDRERRKRTTASVRIRCVFTAFLDQGPFPVRPRLFLWRRWWVTTPPSHLPPVPT